MKKTIFFVIALIFTMSSTFAFANKADSKSNPNNSATPVATENKLSEVEISRLTSRVEEIRNLDKSEMSLKEKSELKKELREIKKNVEGTFLDFHGDFDLMSYLDTDVPGCSIPQMYFKTPGCWTGGHQ